MSGILSHSVVAIVGLALAGLLSVAIPGHLHPATVIRIPPKGDILDAPTADIDNASIVANLVQFGTDRPFTGTGLPGINLQVDTPDSVIGWYVKAWANFTSPPSVRVCSQDSFFFDHYDWTFESNGGGSGAHGAYVGTPNPSPSRSGPSGDQCLTRIGETGVCQLHVRIEGKPNGPLGIYDAPDGRHFDAWDIKIDKEVKVSP